MVCYRFSSCVFLSKWSHLGWELTSGCLPPTGEKWVCERLPAACQRHQRVLGRDSQRSVTPIKTVSVEAKYHFRHICYCAIRVLLIRMHIFVSTIFLLGYCLRSYCEWEKQNWNWRRLQTIYEIINWNKFSSVWKPKQISHSINIHTITFSIEFEYEHYIK